MNKDASYLGSLFVELSVNVELADWEEAARELGDDAHLLTLQPRIRDGHLLLISDNAYHDLWFDYGDGLFINPILIEWAKSKNAYWDWMNPYALILIFED